MQETNIIDDQSLEKDIYEEVQQQNKKYVKWAIVLGIINTILFPFVTDYTRMPMIERVGISLSNGVIGAPTVGFLLGLFFAYLPYRGLTWQQKYRRASLLTLLVIDLTLFIGLLILAFFRGYRYYKFGL